MVNKYEARVRRSRRARAHIRRLGAMRLTVHRTPRHIYAQLIDAAGEKTLATASTLEQELRKGLKSTGNTEAAAAVGKLIAERAKAAGIEEVAFDRAGYKYHGRIRALADAAREAGLRF